MFGNEVVGLTGKTVLITGSTDGLGSYLARDLAGRGATVILHGRSVQRGERLRDQIRFDGGQAVFYDADFNALDAVRSFAHALRLQHPRLDILISNAGVGPGPAESSRETSVDGFELRIAVNYLAGYLLTVLLGPLLIDSGPARVVHVASKGQFPMDFEDPMLVSSYERERAYCQSKLSQIMAAFDFAEAFEGSSVTSNAVHPAEYMPTTLVHEGGFPIRSTIEEGAAGVLELAIGTQFAHRTGVYLDQTREAQADPFAYDETARKKLRDLTYGWLSLPRRPLAQLVRNGV